MTRKINITSTAVEKGIDLAKNFLDKLIIPPVEETGLLLKDKVTIWRYNNQVKMLISAQQNCEKYGINPKAVSLKILCPLLEYAGLEENEVLQDKWANLLTNLVDSSQNIENHVFPYILSQVSVDEFMLVETVYKMRLERILKCQNEHKEFLALRPEKEMELKSQISQLKQQLANSRDEKFYDYETLHKMLAKENELRELDSKEWAIVNSINQPEFIPRSELKEYEISNLTRLGIIKGIPKSYAFVGEHRIQNDPDSKYLYLQDLEIIVNAEEDDLILTELGVLFMSVCNIKREKKAP